MLHSIKSWNLNDALLKVLQTIKQLRVATPVIPQASSPCLAPAVWSGLPVMTGCFRMYKVDIIRRWAWHHWLRNSLNPCEAAQTLRSEAWRGFRHESRHRSRKLSTTFFFYRIYISHPCFLYLTLLLSPSSCPVSPPPILSFLFNKGLIRVSRGWYS